MSIISNYKRLLKTTRLFRVGTIIGLVVAVPLFLSAISYLGIAAYTLTSKGDSSKLRPYEITIAPDDVLISEYNARSENQPKQEQGPWSEYKNDPIVTPQETLTNSDRSKLERLREIKRLNELRELERLDSKLPDGYTRREPTNNKNVSPSIAAITPEMAKAELLRHKAVTKWRKKTVAGEKIRYAANAFFAALFWLIITSVIFTSIYWVLLPKKSD